MRLYQPAWIKLKSDPSIPLVIGADHKLHRRIYKAIIKEKWLDSVYNLDQQFKGYSTRLSKKSVGDILTITLHIIPYDDNLFG